MRLTIELMPHEEVVLLKKQTRFNLCHREEAGQPEGISLSTHLRTAAMKDYRKRRRADS